MNPIAIAALVVVGLVVASHVNIGGKSLLSTGTVKSAPPGPAAQTAGNTQPSNAPVGGFSAQGAGTNQSSPNSVLSTINQGIVVANNALGMFNNLSDLFGSSSDSDPTASVPDWIL